MTQLTAFSFIRKAAKNYVLDNTKNIENLPLFLITQAKNLAPILSKTEQTNLGNKVDELFSYSKIHCLTDDKKYDLNACEVGLLFLLSQEDHLKDYVCLRDLGLSKWEQVEDNDWDWFYSEITNYSLCYPTSYHYLLKINNADANSETFAHSTITLTSRSQANQSGMMWAQAFHSGTYDSDRGGFVSQNGEVLNQHFESLEISETELNTLRNLGITRHFESYSDLEAIVNQDVIEAALAD
ncbi:hypothetical protein [Photobacterium leiognathi]|uniref:hypothetical protein n=1 Tax=Photobacterium leiognathi TaxID=553611 RepID=UPI002980B299|nr:hypothetical protein [Photobacterium leiognathi]